MANTLADIRQAVRDRGSLSASDTKLTDAFLNRAINRALQQVSREADWPWLRTSTTLTTVAGQADYTSPAGWLRTASISDLETGADLPRHPLHILDRDVKQGRPYHYALEGSQLTLGPTPDNVYTYRHRYVQTEPTLALDTDTPLVPDGYTMGAILLAVQWTLSSIREVERATEAEKDFVAWRKRVIDNISPGREGLRVEPREGEWL